LSDFILEWSESRLQIILRELSQLLAPGALDIPFSSTSFLIERILQCRGLIIVLMIVLSWEKGSKVLDLYRNRESEFLGAIERCDKVSGNFFLRLVLCIDRGRIVVSTIGKLPIRLSRIDLREVELDESLIGYETRIIDDLYRFAMLRNSCPYPLIARILLTPSGVS
jgi:hypothetical protein